MENAPESREDAEHVLPETGRAFQMRTAGCIVEGGNRATVREFRTSPDRKGEHPRAHVPNIMGVRQADAYAGLERLYGTTWSAAASAEIRRVDELLRVPRQRLA